MDFCFTAEMGPVVRVTNPMNPDESEFFTNPAYTELDEIGSFEAYCIGHFGEAWVRDLCDGITERYIPVGKGTQKVPEPEMAVVEAAEVVRVEFTRIDRESFYADAIIKAYIRIARNCGRVSDSVIQWYRTRSVFKPFGIGYGMEGYEPQIYDKNDAAPGQRLDKYLIPVMNEDSLDNEVERILAEFYPEALSGGTCVNGYALAAKMGLSVREEPLDDKNLLGRAIFKDCIVDLTEGLTCWRIPVKKNTVLVNSGKGKDKNDSVIHECIHFAKDDLFIWAQSLYNDEISGFDCPVVEGSYPSDGKSPVFWAEWQARMLTYRVKLNRAVVTRKMEEAMRLYVRYYGRGNRVAQLEFTIRRLANDFNVSRCCIKKRLLELGHKEFAGIFDYVNGKYVPPYFFTNGVLGKNQTFTIGFADAVAEYQRNAEFRELLSEGHYVYVEGKFCLNLPKYVQPVKDKGLCLTMYGRCHVDECCLRFEISYKDRKNKYVHGQLDRELTKAEIEHRKLIKPLFAARPGECTGAEMMAFSKWTTETCREIAPLDFNESLKHLMKKRDVRVEEMEERTMISERTVSRLRNDPDCNVKKEHIVAIAVGLNLPPKVSFLLMGKAGMCIRNNDRENFYEFVIDTMYGETIYDVNAFLADADIDLAEELARTGA